MFLKDPKDRGTLFLLAFFHPLLSGSCWLLLKGLERTRLRGQWTSRLEDRGARARLLCSFMYQHRVGGDRGVRDNGGNLGSGCERWEPPSIAPPPTIDIATLDIVVWR